MIKYAEMVHGVFKMPCTRCGAEAIGDLPRPDKRGPELATSCSACGHMASWKLAPMKVVWFLLEGTDI